MTVPARAHLSAVLMGGRTGRSRWVSAMRTMTAQLTPITMPTTTSVSQCVPRTNCTTPTAAASARPQIPDARSGSPRRRGPIAAVVAVAAVRATTIDGKAHCVVLRLSRFNGGSGLANTVRRKTTSPYVPSNVEKTVRLTTNVTAAAAVPPMIRAVIS